MMTMCIAYQAISILSGGRESGLRHSDGSHVAVNHVAVKDNTLASLHTRTIESQREMAIHGY